MQLALLLTTEISIGDPVVDITGTYPDYHSGKYVLYFITLEHLNYLNSSFVGMVRVVSIGGGCGWGREL